MSATTKPSEDLDNFLQRLAKKGTSRRKMIPLFDQHKRRRRDIETRTAGFRAEKESMYSQELRDRQQRLQQRLLQAAQAKPHDPRYSQASQEDALSMEREDISREHQALVDEQVDDLTTRLRGEEERARLVEAREVVDKAAQAAHTLADRLPSVGEEAVAALEREMRSAMQMKGLALGGELHLFGTLPVEGEEYERLSQEEKDRKIDGWDENGALVRLLPGKAQSTLSRRFATIQRSKGALRTNHTLEPSGQANSREYRLLAVAVTEQEVIRCCDEVDGEAMLGRGPGLAYGAFAAARACDAQSYARGILQEAVTNRKLAPVQSIVDHLQSCTMSVIAVTPNNDCGLGPRHAGVWSTAAPMGGHGVPYECVHALGVGGEDERKPTLSEMSDADSGVSRVNFIDTAAVICEATTHRAYIENGCSNNLAVGFSLYGPDLSLVTPIVLSAQAGGGKLGTWKRILALLMLDPELDCLIPWFIAMIFGTAARGWVRMTSDAGSTFAVKQSADLSFTAAALESRAVTVGMEEESVLVMAAEALSRAAVRLNARAFTYAIAAGDLASRACAIWHVAWTLATILEEELTEKKGGRGITRGLGDEELYDWYYRVGGLMWKGRLLLMGARDVARGSLRL